ncbi:CWF19-like protein 1 [Capsaspora owczarzaki ATCC 30864]|uniref:CWF19-like protein 1 n=2 Tax=Capsaspora owczarzaki (strain ATCC 30864) TaxID=595528 RepID=A0A0D2U1S1_CAPO3|nr:CWF19-like protein 1 [Capsaspora owczarzaki ATCC 30864]
MPATMTDGASGSRADWGRVGSDVISILSSALMPRYHFAGALDVYYERLPYRTAPAVSMGLQQGHATRFLALGTQISPTKQKALYAFTIKPLVKEIKSVLLTHPSETTDSPFADAPLRTPAMGTQQEQAGVSMFYSGLDASGKKRRREDDPTDGQARKVPREGYVCNICQQSGHFIQDCPQKDERDAQRLAQREAERGPYVCRICNVPGHPIQECPERVTRPMDQDGHPRLPDNYVCKLCNVPGHHVRDCPSKQDTPPGANRRPPNAPPAAQGPCWFCLGSPQVEKHLVVSIGTELYMALPKGGLSPQHVLLLPIGHVACSKDLGEEARAEMGRYMSSVRALFAAQGCGMVAFERNVRTPHMQIQLIPVPLALTEQLIPTFQEHARRLNYSFQELAPGEDLTAALPSPDTPYFVVEFDSGVRLLLVVTGRFPLMFGREVLCDPALLNAPNKIDWKQCQESAETETTFASDFKAAFKPFDQTDDL